MAEKKDYYEVLGIKKGASDEEIKKALTHNNVLRALTIQSEKYYKKQNINGLYYYELH